MQAANKRAVDLDDPLDAPVVGWLLNPLLASIPIQSGEARISVGPRQSDRLICINALSD